ncbi:DEAD/DEAH box helicase [Bernardetia sp. MNP-M8]|uniref:DEAD/DEAH box helicase n=1 Tax=Bernardetia sp. MNP-M8 TaxID=3127470 RepID=UPI0030D427A1
MQKYKNLKAGYICDTIAKTISEYKKELLESDENEQTKKSKLGQIDGLLDYVSCFDVYFPNVQKVNFERLNPVLAVLNNIITRGLPTKVPLLVEKIFVEIGLLKDNEKEYVFDYSTSINEIGYETVFDLLHIIEPNLAISKTEYGGKGSDFEWNFLNKTLSDYPFLKQIFQSQRDFSTINKEVNGGRSVDFSYSSPYHTFDAELGKNTNRTRGFIVEVDGSHHQNYDYKLYDTYRDAKAEDANFETFRITELQGEKTDLTLEAIFSRASYQIYQSNYQITISDFLEEYSLIFIPLAVARIQKTLIEYFLANSEQLNKKELNIAIIERDFPCGALAIESLKELILNINGLLEENEKQHFPKINLTTFQNEKYVLDKKLHLDATLQNEAHFQKNDFDIILDHSILRRSNVYKETTFQSNSKEIIKIRSAHFVDNSFGNARRTYCTELLNYKKLVEKQDDSSYKSIEESEKYINFFIQTIFRKKEFREGQLPIISRALQLKPVIGLLPTGGGKSLTFQLSAFLQPALCVVVDPIKSLMEDQVRVLKTNWIDCCDFINSNLSREERKEKEINFRFGETLFMFISPERFVIKEFREILMTIPATPFGLSFGYCVIDEVHCVSEWGHDFRTTYLMLGKNAQNYLPTKSKKPVCLIGLTATASFDVLADIERELDIRHDDVSNAIIMIENTIRPELFFRVIDATGKDRMQVLNNDFVNMKQNLLALNTKEVLEKSQFHHFDEFDKKDFAKDKESNELEFEPKYKYLLDSENPEVVNHNDLCSIIFCPVKANRDTSVEEVFGAIQSNSVGFFHGVDFEAKEIQKIVQKHFEDFTNDRLNHMVCTKAFGMGIDKLDIRSTYHILYSSSLESFVQEAGRAGRDKKIAQANVILSKNVTYTLSHLCLRQDSFEDETFKPIINTFHRKAIRKNIIGENFITEESLKETINDTIQTLKYTSDTLKKELIERLNKFITNHYSDRETHDYFYNNSFKGIDTEISQIYNLFKYKEFSEKKVSKVLEEEYNAIHQTSFTFNFWKRNGNYRLYIASEQGESLGYLNLVTVGGSIHYSQDDILLNDILNFIKSKNVEALPLFSFIDRKEQHHIEKQDPLIEEFNKAEDSTFKFFIGKEKKYSDVEIEICKLIEVNPEKEIKPPNFMMKYSEGVKKAMNNSADFEDFILLLREVGDDVRDTALQEKKRRLRFLYNRDRTELSNDTGRLIYRMYCAGFLSDYTIDYQKNSLSECTFNKYNSINNYIDKIEIYLKKYFSESEVSKQIKALNERCSKETIVENIMECLYFLSEFSYKEIASKKERAISEVESILNETITVEKYKLDWFEQNKHIKEQIYFYFNAKYARRDFKIEGKPFSLLYDYKNREKEQTLNEDEILTKYLDVLALQGTPQNNYKHLIGSCKKILRSLTQTDLEKEWVLRLLKAFSMYCVNNTSYISEANGDLEQGFRKFYKDENFHQNDFIKVEKIFNEYFNRLEENILLDNPSFKDIKLIRLNLLLELQSLEIEKMLSIDLS